MLSAVYTAIAADLALDIVGANTCAESMGYMSLRRRGT